MNSIKNVNINRAELQYFPIGEKKCRWEMSKMTYPCQNLRPNKLVSYILYRSDYYFVNKQ